MGKWMRGFTRQETPETELFSCHCQRNLRQNGAKLGMTALIFRGVMGILNKMLSDLEPTRDSWS